MSVPKLWLKAFREDIESCSYSYQTPLKEFFKLDPQLRSADQRKKSKSKGLVYALNLECFKALSSKKICSFDMIFTSGELSVDQRGFFLQTLPFSVLNVK